MRLGCSGDPNAFITVTIRRNQVETADEAAARLAKAWRLCRLRVMRHMKWKRMPFLAVFEKHKSGWPHLHIIARCGFIAQKFLSSTMDELIDSPVVDVRRIYNTRKAVAYVAKYCTKDSHRFGTCKRYWKSKDFDLRPPEAGKPIAEGEGDWSRDEGTLLQWCHRWIVRGWDARQTSQYHARAMPVWIPEQKQEPP